VMVGRERRLITFSRYPDVSLKDARTEAKKLLQIPETNEPQSPTLEAAVSLFLTDRERRIRERTYQDYKRLLNRHCAPIKSKLLSDLVTDDYLKVIDGLKSVPSEQAHAFVAIKTMLRFLVGRGLLGSSPLEYVQGPRKPPSRERVLSDEELKKILLTSFSERSVFGNIVLLCVFTGLRRTEAAQLRWEWVDTKEKTITLPGEITKNKREHHFPYGRAVAELFSCIPTKAGYLFPGRDSNGQFFNGWSRSKTQFDAKCGVNKWSLHDIRRSFATNLAALGVAVHVTERLLNHASGTLSGVAGIYNRYSYFPEMKDAISRWEDKLESLVVDILGRRKCFYSIGESQSSTADS